MKIIVYFLVLCNLGFAAWHFQGSDAREMSAADKFNIRHENLLILLSEIENEQQTVAEGKLCFSLGPFIKQSNANDAQKLLKENEFETTQLQRRDVSRRGYWVILPASESRKKARAQVVRLKKVNIKDYFLVAKGSHENAISLGVYSQKKLARRRIDEMIRLGFIPRMERVPLPRIVYWLNWYKDAKKQPEDVILAEIKKNQSQISKIERSCE